MYVYIKTNLLYFDKTISNGSDLFDSLKSDYDLNNIRIGKYTVGNMDSYSTKFEVGDKSLFAMFQLKYGKYITEIIP